MSRSVRYLQLRDCEPARELAVVGELLEGVPDEGGALVLANLTGESRALGRHQPGAGEAAALRRWTGGRATHYGAGIVSLCALLPSPEAWLSEPAHLSGARLLNRYVRGLLDALRRLGLKPVYPGRDFVTTDAGQVAYLSFERAPNGVFLFQAIVAVASPFSSEPPPRFPGLPDPPGYGTLSAALGERANESSVTDALAEGFASRFLLALEPLAPERHAIVSPEGAALPSTGERLEDPHADDFVSLPIGRLGAAVSLSPDGSLEAVRFAGDWIASSLDVATLEDALVGALPGAESTSRLIERWLAVPAHLVVGVSGGEPIVEALRRAARRVAASE